MPNQWKQKRGIMNCYDRTARTYDTQYGEEQDAKIEAALENSHIDDGAMILDAGCGTGLLFRHVAKYARLVVGIDTSRNLLRQAKTKAKAYGRIAIVRADADQMPFIAKAFTDAFALTLLQNTPQPVTTLKEIGRVTQPNAAIIITGLKKRFTLESFTQPLTHAQLEITSLRNSEKLKDYVFTCRKRL
jgi:ubiquinone/menaquinone biosynthesis C-methylase UbiE